MRVRCGERASITCKMLTGKDNPNKDRDEGGMRGRGGREGGSEDGMSVINSCNQYSSSVSFSA